MQQLPVPFWQLHSGNTNNIIRCTVSLIVTTGFFVLSVLIVSFLTLIHMDMVCYSMYFAHTTAEVVVTTTTTLLALLLERT